MIATITFRELKAFFKSPMAYVISGFFTLIMGWIFFNLLVTYVENLQNLPQSMTAQWNFINAVVLKLFGNINFIFLFIAPIITMRLFAEEKKEMTIDLYYAAPVSDYQLVLGKYFASVLMGIFLISTTMLFPFVFKTANFENFSFVYTGYLGLILNMMCYFSVGIFASSLTNNQIISALTSFIFIMALWMLSWAGNVSSNFFMMEISRYLSVVSHYELFAKGLITTSGLIYYVSFITTFIFLTKKVIESRNW
jgi:ABC-2 type transport system permease protein